MKWLNNINPFYWKRKAQCLQDHLDNVAGVRLQQEQKIIALTTNISSLTTQLAKTVEDYNRLKDSHIFSENVNARLQEELVLVARERDELRDKVPDYSLPEYVDLAQYIAEGATPREAKMMLDLVLLKQQVHELGTVCGGKSKLELVEKTHNLECELEKAKAINDKWFTTVVGFEPFSGILMNQALRGKELMLDPIIAKLNEVADEEFDDNNA